MKRTTQYYISAAIGCISVSIIMIWYAVNRKYSTSLSSELLFYLSGVVISIGIIVSMIVCLKLQKKRLTPSVMYVSFPFDIDSSTVKLIKKAYTGFPIIYSDEIISPGDEYQEIVDTQIKHVGVCFMFVGDNLTPRQKYELLRLKQNGAKIIPVIEQSTNKIPQAVQNYQPISLEQFISYSKEGFFENDGLL